ncbi:MAG: 4Fe-4S binding protein, partial [Oscillospiraceae bacterium]|nr:4Fe-4S binding protein [Oscillospiraceae bacterium]
ALFVVIFPILFLNDLSGLGSPWFCKYICPAGTIFAALPILVSNEVLRDLAGNLFIWKISLAVGIVAVSIVVYRFFCRVICPLGAVYSFFNPIAFIRIDCDKSKCVSCGICEKNCHIRLNPVKQPNSPECVRCGSCVKKCGTGALRYDAVADFSFSKSKRSSEKGDV